MSYLRKQIRQFLCYKLVSRQIPTFCDVPFANKFFRLDEKPDVQYSDIGGMDMQKQEIREAVELPLTHFELYKQIGIDPPRGVLMFGPPGCGKTMLAKAVAHHTTGDHFFHVNFQLRVCTESSSLQLLLFVSSVRNSYRNIWVKGHVWLEMYFA